MWRLREAWINALRTENEIAGRTIMRTGVWVPTP
jgi:hypothetical protein